LRVGEASGAGGLDLAAHRRGGRLAEAGSRNAPVALAAHDRLGHDHLVAGKLGVLLDVDAPGAVRAFLAREAAELDEVRAARAGDSRVARRLAASRNGLDHR